MFPCRPLLCGPINIPVFCYEVEHFFLLLPHALCQSQKSSLAALAGIAYEKLPEDPPKTKTGYCFSSLVDLVEMLSSIVLG